MNNMNKAEEYIKRIPCPEPEHKHTAVLFCYPHKYAGIYECPFGYSESHEHNPENYEVAEADNWPSGPHEDMTTSKVYICGGEDGCGITIEGVYPDA